MTQPLDHSPEVTPTQAAFLMRHLDSEDRDRLIAEAGEVVVDMRDAFSACKSGV